MAGIKATTSNTFAGQFTSNWWSYTDIKMPDIKKKTVDLYGQDFGLLEITELMGNTYDMPNDTFSFYEQDSLERLITIGGAGITTGALGADITFTLDAADYDARGNAYLREGDAILVPKAYLNAATLMDYSYVVKKPTLNGTSTSYTASPLLADGTVFQQAQIATAIPAGTKLGVTFDAWARGTKQPRGTTQNWYKRTCRTGIHKDTFEIEGGNESQTWIPITLSSNGMIVPKGTPGSRDGFIAIGQQQKEAMINKKINGALFIAQPNDNASHGTVTNDAGESSPLLTTTGILPWAQLLAQKAPYTGSFEMANLDAMKPLMISQGITTQDMMWMAGDLLYADAENAGYNFIKEYGHDNVMTRMDEIGLNFRQFKKLNINFILREMKNFSNPNNFGAAAYNDYYRKLGIMAPMSEIPVKIGSKDASPTALGNLTLGVKNYNGENRRRVMGLINGMTGHPYQVVTEVDVIKGYTLCEIALILSQGNQFILQEGN
jgi:hypothetical protein